MPISRHCVRLYFYAIALLLGLSILKTTAQGLEAGKEEGFSIYCNSNMDGTGKCSKVETGETLNCIIIPGQIIACRDKMRKKYECVQYGAVIALQTQFFCLSDNDNSVNDSLFDGDGGNTVTPPSSKIKESPSPLKTQPSLVNPFLDLKGTQSTPKDEVFPNAF